MAPGRKGEHANWKECRLWSEQGILELVWIDVIGEALKGDDTDQPVTMEK